MRPIILVPGFRDNMRILRRLERRLLSQGATVRSISPQPSSGHVALEALAEQLAQAIQTYSGPEPIDLFGFSMGGLICRYYVQRLGGAQHVQRLVTVATPHFGSWLSYVFGKRPALLQMRPGSRFLQHLNQDLDLLAPLDPVSIWTPFDLSILPPTSSCLPIGRNIRILSPFHGTLMIDRRVHSFVCDAFLGTNGRELDGDMARETDSGQAERTLGLAHGESNQDLNGAGDRHQDRRVIQERGASNHRPTPAPDRFKNRS